MTEREKTCCFTGHRPVRLPWGSRDSDPRCLDLKEQLAATLNGIYESGYRHFICGMAEGCDLYFCEAVMALREEHPEITVEAAIPFSGQADRWPPAQKRRYERLVSECDRQTLLQTDYTPGCMMNRNRYMVDHSSLLLACYNGRPGGTQSTMLYAMRENIPIITIEI